ncbi:MAG: multidrug ABC transporter permease, partial [Corynebacterium kroppenstedtii]|nr:multidrug ABC transporter permease [Corynebacterium kroppenstedtii]
MMADNRGTKSLTDAQSLTEASTRDAETTEDSRFAPGTFEPQPRRASTTKLVSAQARMETLLFLRHGEQQLLSMVIPIAMLIGFTLMPFLDLDDPIARLFPMVLAVAVMSAGFTGQAIAVVFDRRYGALKRMGASALPKWAIIAGKACAVVVVVLLQTL